MAYPTLHRRGDIVVMADWEGNDTFTNFCGATSISLNIENSVDETIVGDCDDWTLPTKTIAAYGAQTVTMTINAQLAASNRDKILRWAHDQLIVPIRVHIVDAASGEVEYIDGNAMLPTTAIDNIGSTDTNAIVTTTLNLRFEDGVEFTDAT